MSDLIAAPLSTRRAHLVRAQARLAAALLLFDTGAAVPDAQKTGDEELDAIAQGHQVTERGEDQAESSQIGDLVVKDIRAFQVWVDPAPVAAPPVPVPPVSPSPPPAAATPGEPPSPPPPSDPVAPTAAGSVASPAAPTDPAGPPPAPPYRPPYDGR